MSYCGPLLQASRPWILSEKVLDDCRRTCDKTFAVALAFEGYTFGRKGTKSLEVLSSGLLQSAWHQDKAENVNLTPRGPLQHNKKHANGTIQIQNLQLSHNLWSSVEFAVSEKVQVKACREASLRYGTKETRWQEFGASALLTRCSLVQQALEVECRPKPLCAQHHHSVLPTSCCLS